MNPDTNCKFCGAEMRNDIPVFNCGSYYDPQHRTSVVTDLCCERARHKAEAENQKLCDIAKDLSGLVQGCIFKMMEPAKSEANRIWQRLAAELTQLTK